MNIKDINHREKGWAFSYETMVEWDNKGKLYFPANKSQRIRRKTFLDEYEGQPVQNYGEIFMLLILKQERH